MSRIDFKPNGDYMEIYFPEKVVKVRGHQDEDAYRMFTESFETSTSLTNQERSSVRDALKHLRGIVID